MTDNEKYHFTVGIQEKAELFHYMPSHVITTGHNSTMMELDLISEQQGKVLIWYLPISDYQQNVVLSTTLLHNGHSHLNSWCEGCWSCLKPSSFGPP